MALKLDVAPKLEVTVPEPHSQPSVQSLKVTGKTTMFMYFEFMFVSSLFIQQTLYPCGSVNAGNSTVLLQSLGSPSWWCDVTPFKLTTVSQLLML